MILLNIQSFLIISKEALPVEVGIFQCFTHELILLLVGIILLWKNNLVKCKIFIIFKLTPIESSIHLMILRTRIWNWQFVFNYTALVLKSLLPPHFQDGLILIEVYGRLPEQSSVDSARNIRVMERICVSHLL